MKRIKFLGMLFCLVILSACTSGLELEKELQEVDIPNIADLDGIEWISYMLEAEISDDIVYELERLEKQPYLFTYRSSDDEVARIMLIDLTSGEIDNILEGRKEQSFLDISLINEGYYVVEVLDMETWERYLILLNSEFQLLKETRYDVPVLLSLWDTVARIENGELYIYGFDQSMDWSKGAMGELLRVNLHSGEYEVLFEAEATMRLIDFVGNEKVFVENRVIDIDSETFEIYYGVLNLETGEFNVFESNGFVAGEFDFQNLKVLASENISADENRNEIIIFDLSDMSSHILQLKDNDSHFVRFSHDGNHVVTVNGYESVFRVYDVKGNVTIELDIEFPEPEPLPWSIETSLFQGSFSIFSLTEKIYSIHSHVHPISRHIQFIELP